MKKAYTRSVRMPDRKSWNSEFFSYNNRRGLPSKWEDAERWIFSPLSGDDAVRTSLQRRPKSKSGPLGTNKFTENYPLSTAVMNTDCLLSHRDPSMARSISLHGCSQPLHQSSLPLNKDVKFEDVCGNILRRDRATQISPENNNQSSSRKLSSILELQSISKPEIQDIPVGTERVTMTRWSKKDRSRTKTREWDVRKTEAVNIQTAEWEVSAEASKTISMIQKEEAKISSWENLQRAKAEAAIRKLEIKLEKKRSSSMDKIMNKLMSAQNKAEEMRSSIVATTNHQSGKPAKEAQSFRHIGCFKF